ncbi:hypothetical protein RZS08_25485, partial [Arthrospira platensis SPKY1]|nr:hypothetical protein [Arthrospira platensis SPKY1]
AEHEQAHTLAGTGDDLRPQAGVGRERRAHHQSAHAVRQDAQRLVGVLLQGLAQAPGQRLAELGDRLAPVVVVADHAVAGLEVAGEPTVGHADQAGRTHRLAAVDG